MRIAFFVTEFPSLSETFILNQITGLIDRGHEVDIYSSRRGNTAKVHPDVDTYGLLERAHCCPVPDSALVRYAKALQILAVRGFSSRFAAWRALFCRKFGFDKHSLGLLYFIAPLLPVRRYDAIVCHFGTNGLKGLAARELGVLTGKLVTVFHGYDITRFLLRAGEKAYDELFAAGELFLPISENWRRRLSRLGCAEHKTTIHHMGIDVGKFAFQPRKIDQDGQVRILSIARLVEKKGIEFGIRAFARAAPRTPRLQYRIVGDGPLKVDLQRLIDDLGVTEQVLMLGWRNQDEIVEELRNAHVLLAPSVTAGDGDQEGIPVVLMEALAVGLPIVTTRHSGIPELVHDGESGYLVPERDVGGLAEALVRLTNAPDSWPELGRNGRDFVERHFNIHTLNDELVQHLQRLITEGA